MSRQHHEAQSDTHSSNSQRTPSEVQRALCARRGVEVSLDTASLADASSTTAAQDSLNASVSTPFADTPHSATYGRTLSKVNSFIGKQPTTTDRQPPGSPNYFSPKGDRFFANRLASSNAANATPAMEEVYLAANEFADTFLLPENQTYSRALSTFMADRREACGDQLKGTGIPCILFTTITIDGPTRDIPPAEYVLVSISGIQKISEEDRAQHLMANIIGSFWDAMNDFTAHLNRNSSRNYVFLGGRSGAYFELLEGITLQFNAKAEKPKMRRTFEKGEEHKNCAERSAFNLLQKLISICGPALTVTGSQAYKFELPQASAAAVDEREAQSAATDMPAKKSPHTLERIPPCKVCEKHVPAVKHLALVALTLSAANPRDTSSAQLLATMSSGSFDEAFANATASAQGTDSPVITSPVTNEPAFSGDLARRVSMFSVSGDYGANASRSTRESLDTVIDGLQVSA